MGIKIAIFGAAGKIGKETSELLQKLDDSDYPMRIPVDAILSIGHGNDLRKIVAAADDVSAAVRMAKHRSNGNAYSSLRQMIAAANRGEETFHDAIAPEVGDGHQRQDTRCNDLGSEPVDFIVIVAAGHKPAADRTQINRSNSININAAIVDDIIKQIHKNLEINKGIKPPHIIIVTNPVDAVATYCQERLGIQPCYVSGMAGLLDEERMRYIAADILGVDRGAVTGGIVLGEHGSGMLPLPRTLLINNQSIEEHLLHTPIAGKSKEEILEEIATKTKGEGKRIDVSQGGIGAYYSPAAAIVATIAAIVNNDMPSPITCSSWSDIYQCYIGQQAWVGHNGIQPLDTNAAITLTGSETSHLEKAAQTIKENSNILRLQHALSDNLSLDSIDRDKTAKQGAWIIKLSSGQEEKSPSIISMMQQACGKQAQISHSKEKTTITVQNMPDYLDAAMPGIIEVVISQQRGSSVLR